MRFVFYMAMFFLFGLAMLAHGYGLATWQYWAGLVFLGVALAELSGP